MGLPSDFTAELRRRFAGDIRLDPASRILYSTDASIYQIEPLGVLIPRSRDDLQAAVELAAQYRIPVLARGAGTSLAGQAIGPAVILDCSRWLDHILALNPDARTATVEPGVVLDDLNRAAAKHGLQFGPDPASAERASMGGIIANNGTGAHSVRYGMAADHIRSANVVLSDGGREVFREVSVPGRNLQTGSRHAAIVGSALRIREEMASEIRARYPHSWRSSAGYRLNYLLGWSSSAPAEWSGGAYPAYLPADRINLAHLLAGSEGTLAVIESLEVNLVPKPAHTVLAILAYPDLGAACDSVPGLLRSHPSARGRMNWLRGDPEAILVVEFSGDDPGALRKKAAAMAPAATVLEAIADQSNVWAVRKAGLGLLDSQPRSQRPISFVEDCAVPVENLGAYVRGMQRIMSDYQAIGGIYGHASAGCLHIRPVLDLRTEPGRRSLRAISTATAELALGLGGSMTSEHGDGLARAEWLPSTYGEPIIQAMSALKAAADPDGILNPGKKLKAPLMDQNLRYGPEHPRRAWSPGFDSRPKADLTLAIERCNGQGVCRKASGVMCPSFQATREEMHSTRGRANLLRELISSSPTQVGGEAGRSRSGGPALDVKSPAMLEATFEALDLCLGCKGCTAECPSGVDMPALKSEFLNAYYASHARPLRDYLFGYFHVTAGLLSSAAPLINALARLWPIARMGSWLLGVSPARPLPKFERTPARARPSTGRRTVHFLRDPFNHFVDTRVEQAAFDLLDAAGIDVQILDCMGAGASLVSKGFFKAARRHAEMLLSELQHRDPTAALPVLVIEPSELSTLRHDYVSILPDMPDAQRSRLEGAESVEAYLSKLPSLGTMRVAEAHPEVHLHPHCHQKADDAELGRRVEEEDPSLQFLRGLGLHVTTIPAGCCGMAGTFGYESEHYALSQKVGELALFGWVRDHPGVRIAATGAACRMQILQGTGVRAEHPLVLAARGLGL